MLNRMRKLKVEQEGAVGASAQLVYRLIADDQHHQRFLPKGFSDFEVLEGGRDSAQTAARGGRSREYTMRVAEPEPGRVITETDQSSSLVTSFTVAPSGDTCRVLISTTWNGTGGVGGFFERLFAPRVLRRMYADELTRLDRYAREQAAAAP